MHFTALEGFLARGRFRNVSNGIFCTPTQGWHSPILPIASRQNGWAHSVDEADDKLIHTCSVLHLTFVGISTSTSDPNMDNNTTSPLTSGPTINLPPESSTVNDEAQDEKDDSEYQVLWSKVMDKGNYKSSSTYTNVEVLLLCWAEGSDDMAVKDEVSRLKSTFETCLNYHAQISYLDATVERKLQVQVNTIVQAFIGAHDKPTTLLIVYYAGHGKPGSYYGSLVLHGLVESSYRIAWVLIVPAKLLRTITTSV